VIDLQKKLSAYEKQKLFKQRLKKSNPKESDKEYMSYMAGANGTYARMERRK